MRVPVAVSKTPEANGDGVVRIPIVIPVHVQVHLAIATVEVRDRNVPPRIVAGNHRAPSVFRDTQRRRTCPVIIHAGHARNGAIPNGRHGVFDQSLRTLSPSVDERNSSGFLR